MPNLRAALPADEAFLLGLTRRLADFPVPPWRTGREIAGADDHILLQALRHAGDGTAIFIGEEDGVPLGYVFVSTRSDYFTGARYAHIEILAVDEKAEGRGVARGLVEAAEAWSRGQGHMAITLNVFAANTRARGLYEHLGYLPELLTYRKEV
jgi:GNAT superfamily N-acetyltransferase